MNWSILGGAVSVLIIYVAEMLVGIEVNTEIHAALATVVTAMFVYFSPANTEVTPDA